VLIAPSAPTKSTAASNDVAIFMILTSFPFRCFYKVSWQGPCRSRWESKSTRELPSYGSAVVKGRSLMTQTTCRDSDECRNSSFEREN